MGKEQIDSPKLRVGLEKFREHVSTSIDVDGVYDAITGFLQSPRDVLQEEKIDAIMLALKGFPIYGDHVHIILLFKKLILSQKPIERALAQQSVLYSFIEELNTDLSS